MITLGIESTAHTLGIGICKGSKVLANILDTYIPKKGGIVPREAADHHAKVLPKALKSALENAGLGIENISLIAFAQGPGIGAPLSIGVHIAKYLGIKYNIPIIGVNHPFAHIFIAETLTKLRNPLAIFTSGANTQIIEKTGDEIFVLGETLDIGVGNLLDKVARELEISPPNGKTLSEHAEGGRYVQMPYTVKGMNFSFSGILTKAKKIYNEYKGDKDKIRRDIAYSVIETVFSQIIEASERAIFLTGKKNVIACGGVAQNRRFKDMIKTMAKEDRVNVGICPDEYNRDNGAMIAAAGAYLYKKYGTKNPDYWKPKPRFRIEEYLAYINE